MHFFQSHDFQNSHFSKFTFLQISIYIFIIFIELADFPKFTFFSNFTFLSNSRFSNFTFFEDFVYFQVLEMEGNETRKRDGITSIGKTGERSENQR